MFVWHFQIKKILHHILIIESEYVQSGPGNQFSPFWLFFCQSLQILRFTLTSTAHLESRTFTTESFISDNSVWMLDSACCKAFWSVSHVCLVQFSQRITVIWENIKSECFREIIPFMNNSNCLSLRLFIHKACQNTSVFTDLSKFSVLALLGSSWNYVMLCATFYLLCL